MESSELSLLKQFIIKNGTMKSFKKKEPFITEGNKSTYVCLLYTSDAADD